MTLLFIGIVLGLIIGVRVGTWRGLRKLGEHEFRQRSANIKKVNWWGL